MINPIFLREHNYWDIFLYVSASFLGLNNLSVFCFSERSEPDSSTSYSHFHSPSLPMQRFRALSLINQNFPHRRASSNVPVHHKKYSLDFDDGEDDASSCPQGTFLTDGDDLASSFRSLVTNNYTTADDQASISGAPTNSSSRFEVYSASVCYVHYSSNVHSSKF